MEIPKENVEMTKNNYLLKNDRNYKILLLYILRTLNNDVKQKIFKILINEEIVLELEEISQLIRKCWSELSCIDINLQDIGKPDLEYEQVHKRKKY